MEWKKIGIASGIGIVVYMGIRYLLPVAIPFFIGWLFAVKVLPMACWMEKRWKIPRGIGGGILILFFTGTTSYIVWRFAELFLAQVGSLLEKVNLWSKDTMVFFERCCQVMGKYTGIETGQIRQFLIFQAGKIQEELQNHVGTEGLGYLITTIKGLGILGAGFITAVIFGTLVVKDVENIRRKMEKRTFTRKLLIIGRKICQTGGKYLKGQLFIMLVVSTVCIVGFWFLKNPYFVAAGVLVGFLDMLPLIGTGTILIPWSILWCIQGEYAKAAGYFLLYLVAYLVRELLEPKVLGKQIGLHPALMVVSVYVGFYIYGFAGFFLGPLTLVIMGIVWEEIEDFLKLDGVR